MSLARTEFDARQRDRRICTDLSARTFLETLLHFWSSPHTRYTRWTSKWIKGTRQNSKLEGRASERKGRRRRERESHALEIGRLLYCSIFECFVVLSFDAAAEKPFQSSSGCREQREYEASVAGNVRSKEWIGIGMRRAKFMSDIYKRPLRLFL